MELYPTLSCSVMNAIELGETGCLPKSYVPKTIDLFCNDSPEPDLSVINGRITASTLIPNGWAPDAIELQLDGRPALVAIGNRILLNRLERFTSSRWPINQELTVLIGGWIDG
ncbi:MAG: hypothetical protein AAF974_00075 [Cyanobacteria bacterium P01_E01_bin.34]